ncbi:MAG: FtsQ-type POTRA domain-containing protein [Chlorobiaceae bacterium]
MLDTEFPNSQGSSADPDPQGYSEENDSCKLYDSFVPEYTGSRKAWLFITFIVLVALATLTYYATGWKKDVVVREFVVDGTSIVSDKQLIASLKSYQGRNLQELDSEALKKEIVSFPYVRDAFISKELNGIVRIRIVERVPVALTLIGSEIMTIDQEGYLLPGKDVFLCRMPKLLAVRGISRLKTTVNSLPQLNQRDITLLLQFLDALLRTDYASILIKEFHFAENNQAYCITINSPTRFIVGNDGNFKEKLKKFEIFWQKVISKKGFDAFETVDLRFRDRIFTKDFVSVKKTIE